MGRELLLVIDTVANEKEVSRDMLFEAMEEALEVATSKLFSDDVNIRVNIDRKTGDYNTFRLWDIVPEDYEIENHAAELYVDVAKEKGHNVEIGCVLEEKLDSIKFGRIAAMTARQVVMQKVRNEERRLMVSRFKDKIGKVVYGEVKSVTKDFLILDLGYDAEGILYRTELLPKERYRLNDKLRACILRIDEETKSHQIILSRSSKKMLEALLVVEVPEVSEQLIDIVSIARDSGSRSKVSVKSNDKRIDPVGACVGMRGSRIQAITDELQGERVDIVLWDDNPAQYVVNSVSPAEVVSVVQDEDSKIMEVAVKEDQLSQAIGKNGQNVRLASMLTGWQISIMAESLAVEKQQEEATRVSHMFVDVLDIDKYVAEVLVEEGFTTLEEIAYTNNAEMIQIEGFDEEIIDELQQRARTALLSQALNAEVPHDDLLNMEGMTEKWANILARNKIVAMEDLAELATDDLTDIVSMSKEQATSLIMAARAPWFKQEDK
jgi:N utilization substance protein A